MIKITKRDILLIAILILVFLFFINFDFTLTVIKKAIEILFPIIFGLIIAFILNVPMRGFEGLLDRITSKCKRKMNPRFKNVLCLLLSIISIALVLLLVFTIAVPQITESVKNLIETVDRKIPDFLIYLEQNGIDTTYITEKLSNFNLEEIIKQITRGAFTIVETAVDATFTVVKSISSVIVSFVIAIYLLLDKYNLSRQLKKGFLSILSKRKVGQIYRVSYLVRDTFARFLSGQCLEASILAILIFLMFTIFRLPYAGLVALLAAVFSFIPYIGSFIACLVGALLTFIDSPAKVIVCVAVYLACQLIEQHFIYPHVVGNSVGLSPFYTIVAVFLGGNLFGVFGMLFFIPLFSVIFTILKDWVNDKAVSSSTKI